MASRLCRFFLQTPAAPFRINNRWLAAMLWQPTFFVQNWQKLRQMRAMLHWCCCYWVVVFLKRFLAVTGDVSRWKSNDLLILNPFFKLQRFIWLSRPGFSNSAEPRRSRQALASSGFWLNEVWDTRFLAAGWFWPFPLLSWIKRDFFHCHVVGGLDQVWDCVSIRGITETSGIPLTSGAIPHFGRSVALDNLVCYIEGRSVDPSGAIESIFWGIFFFSKFSFSFFLFENFIHFRMGKSQWFLSIVSRSNRIMNPKSWIAKVFPISFFESLGNCKVVMVVVLSHNGQDKRRSQWRQVSRLILTITKVCVSNHVSKLSKYILHILTRIF